MKNYILKFTIYLILLICINGKLLSEMPLSLTLSTDENTQLRDIKFLDDKFAVVIGFKAYSQTEFEGIIAVTEDGGINWKLTNHPDLLLFGIDINANRKIQIVGFSLANSKGFIYTSEDKGQNWKLTTCDGSQAPDITSLYAIKYLDNATILSAGYDGMIIKSTDDGMNWKTVSQADSGQSIWNIRQSKGLLYSTSIFADETINKFKLFLSTDNGNSWNDYIPVLPEGLFAETIEFDSSGNIYLFGSLDGKYAIFESINDGIDWSNIYLSNEEGSFKSAYIDVSGKIYACGENGKIVYGFSNEWDEKNLYSEYFVWKVQNFNNKIYFITAAGNVYKLDQTASLVESESDEILLLTPVPSVNQIYISGIEILNQQFFEIFSMEGTIMINGKLQGNIIDISRLVKGFYILRIQLNDKETCLRKFIKN